MRITHASAEEPLVKLLIEVVFHLTAVRDWKAVAALMGSRDHRAVASHAQKHFIRMCMDGQLLPPKVPRTALVA